VLRLDYTSPVDLRGDWALLWPNGDCRDCVVHLHGHGSTGDQIFTRPDIRDAWLATYRRRGLAVLGPNLRGNAWMAPEAAADLHALVAAVRKKYAVQRFYFVSGSMGGTGNLVYGSLFPKDVAAMVALCPVTSIGGYHQWCVAHPGGVVDEIRKAIEQSYGGRPDEMSERYASQDALAHASRLDMPLLIAHGTADPAIPVEQSRKLASRLRSKPGFTYREIPDGDHDSPLHRAGAMEWLERQLDV
jgi:pimeloyl-ACP methyl ester carboxylesterase